MKKLLATALALLVVSLPVFAQTEVRLLANTSPPYSDRQLPDQGLALEIVNHVFTRAGYTANIEFESWSRAMEGVSIGVYDALAAAWYTEERAREFLFSKPYLSNKLVLLKLRSDPAGYTSLEQLAGKRLGHQVDYAYGVDFDAIPRLQLVPQNYALQNLLDLMNGKVDAVIGDQRTLAMQMHEYLQNDIQKFQVADIALPVRSRHVAATRQLTGEEEVVAAFNKALAEAQRDGSIDAIVRKWDERYSIAD